MSKKMNAIQNKQRFLSLENARLFIDAYNLLLNDRILSRQFSSEQSRDLLRTKSRQYLVHHPGHIIYLVFDGDSSVGCVPEKSRSQILNEKQAVRDVFTDSGETADQWIIRIAGNLFPASNLFVITYDTGLIRAVSAFGVEQISPDFFLAVTETSSQARRRKRQQGDGSRHESAGVPDRDKQVTSDALRDIEAELHEVLGDNLDDPLTY